MYKAPDKDKSPEKERRGYPRVTAPVFFRSPRIFSPKRRVSDISPNGVRIFSNEYVEPDRRLEIELFLPFGSTVVAIVRVVWINELPSGADASYDVGLEFIRLSSDAEQELESVLQYS